jgi:hypothetical protein
MSLWTELLFLHGHIADPELARRLVKPAPPADPSVPKAGKTPARLRRPTYYLAQSFRRSLRPG